MESAQTLWKFTRKMSKNKINYITLSLVAAISWLILDESFVLSLSGMFQSLGALFGILIINSAIPVIIVSIPAGIYWLITRNKMPGYATAIWSLWALMIIVSVGGKI